MEPRTYTFQSDADDQEVAVIEVCFRALNLLDTGAASRAAEYLAKRFMTGSERS